ncbi:beta-ketoacyl synthase N-terminal-like domain-containing protein [Mesonia ostreae]|uniref:Beta-ketoacyl synthase N-terminal-like domain-containing protein n=1 Tax=Mesonia ostreae TaxID=861110 RepID=A0ABU2KI34_9FLAO|nr:beta-ketoacyl synthase N-terminal-like domain-containing protein [Mesonia ostreae]MDT0294378.1 beta-ketoacyl synthase N-terminal-like domain-containing protein [Mesonia ostreae]
MFINGISSLNAQAISLKQDAFFEEIKTYNTRNLQLYFSDFKTYIKPSAMRRMSSSIRMGVVASLQALEDANLSQPDAIITGTGMGCKTDSDVFLEALLESDEGLLSPTKFIQSTHNTVAGQIALQLQCKAYNMTFVQGSASFESALLDSFLQVASAKSKNFLVGGVDEISIHTNELHVLDAQLKEEVEIHNLQLLEYTTPGSILGEGTSFFVTSSQKTDSSYALVRDIQLYNQLKEEELESIIHSFLKRNKITSEEIDVIVLGNNGDVSFDNYYHILQEGLLKKTAQAYYKHLVGEFYTASGFGFWLACKILKLQKIPSVCLLNNIQPQKMKKILLYNQYRGRDHSLILLESC